MRFRTLALAWVTLLAVQVGWGSTPDARAPQAAQTPAAQAAEAVQAPAAHAQAAQAAAATDPDAFMRRYCIACHTEQQKERGTVPIALDGLSVDRVASGAEAWEKVVRKMRAGLMPPAGMPRPDEATEERFLGWLEGELDTAARVNANPGRTEPLHRLNRTEYQNAVRDLLGLEIDAKTLLPPDDVSYGFDNIAGILKLSPTLMERYLGAAQKISRTAIGTPPPFPTVDYFRVADDLSQEDRLPGHAFGTRGGTRIRYAFPMDAEYTFRVELSRDLNEQVPIYMEAQRLEISIDGQRVHVFTLPGIGEPQAATDADAARARVAAAAPGSAPPGQTARDESDAPRAVNALPPPSAPRLSRQGQESRNRIDRDWEIRVPVSAGTREVQVAFLKEGAALPETARLPFLRPYPAGVNIAETRGGAYLRSVEISGPYDPKGPGSSPSRQHIFTCYPTAATEEAPCAQAIFTRLARLAYRRPVEPADVEPLLAMYTEGYQDGGFEAGVERGLLRLLVSPEFLLRVTTDPPGLDARVYRVSDVELASRLSFFLWSSIPDEELLEVAERGQLSDPVILEAQVRRMIEDPRFSAFVEGFAGQWLFLRNLEATVPVQQNFPDFDDTLRQAFRRETELFFESLVREDRSALDLLRADYTFVNERLARHYGIPNVQGPRFRRVALPADVPRRGLLGHGSVLTVTSYPDRTSPVLRGKWILENLLGAPPPAPPPDIPELEPANFAGPVQSMRERIAHHRRNPVCASCHSMMDPLGLALENFDAIGRWRTLEETGAPIDASGALPSGEKFDGVEGLTDALLRSDIFVTTLTEKMLTYALGRGLEYYDAPAVRAIVRGAAGREHRLQDLIRGIVQSAPFQMRRAES